MGEEACSHKSLDSLQAYLHKRRQQTAWMLGLQHLSNPQPFYSLPVLQYLFFSLCGMCVRDRNRHLLGCLWGPTASILPHFPNLSPLLKNNNTHTCMLLVVVAEKHLPKWPLLHLSKAGFAALVLTYLP